MLKTAMREPNAIGGTGRTIKGGYYLGDKPRSQTSALQELLSKLGPHRGTSADTFKPDVPMSSLLKSTDPEGDFMSLILKLTEPYEGGY